MTNDDGERTEEMFAEVGRALAAPEAFERIVDGLPGAIDAGYAPQFIVILKLWGAHHGVYPISRMVQALERYGAASVRAPVENSGAPPTATTSQHRDIEGEGHD